MPKEDYLIKYLEKLSRVIAAMFGFRDKGLPEESLRIADEAFKELFDLKLVDLGKMPVDSFTEMIKNSGYNANFLELLAGIVYETALSYEMQNPRESVDFYLKTLELFRLLNEKDKTFSFEREDKIDTINQRINFLNEQI